MESVINVTLITFFILLLIFAILLLAYNFICDGQNCKPFTIACQEKHEKDQVLVLLDNLCNDGIWPFAYIASAILTGLIFACLPFVLTIKYFTIIFLLSFLVFYSIYAFFIHHYVNPIKQYISTFIKKQDLQ